VNDYLRAVLLGIIEGLTEFLPVSSTAHMRIVEPWLGISLEDPFWKMFTIVIQLGAILAVVWLFRHRLVGFVRTFPRGADGQRKWFYHPLTLVFISFVVTAGPAFLLNKKIDKMLENLWVIGIALIVGGIIMWVVDALLKRPRTHRMEDMSILDAIAVGFAQIFSAVFPGTSRSMATIAAGQLFGLSRLAALEFSFFVSIPIMFAACGYSLLKFIRGKEGSVAMNADRWGVLAVGLVVSFIVALLVIKWFTTWVRQHGFIPFAIYRLALGAGVLLWAWQKH